MGAGSITFSKALAQNLELVMHAVSYTKLHAYMHTDSFFFNFEISMHNTNVTNNKQPLKPV